MVNSNKKEEKLYTIEIKDIEKFLLPGSIILSSIILGLFLLIGFNSVSSSISSQPKSSGNSPVAENNGDNIQQNLTVNDKITLVANNIGVDANQVLSCVESDSQVKEIINKNANEASNAQIFGTPGFVVGKINNGTLEGVKIPGAYPFDTFKQAIDAYLSGNDNKINEFITKFASDSKSNTEDIKAKISIANAQFKGSDGNKVGVAEFFDLQCGFCKRHFQQTYPQIVQEYLDSNKIAYYKINYPILGDESQKLALGAECVLKISNNKDKYFDYIKEVYSI